MEWKVILSWVVVSIAAFKVIDWIIAISRLITGGKKSITITASNIGRVLRTSEFRDGKWVPIAIDLSQVDVIESIPTGLEKQGTILKIFRSKYVQEFIVSTDYKTCVDAWENEID